MIDLPCKVNALNGTRAGIDATGTLLYCAPDRVPKRFAPACRTQTGAYRFLALDSGNLYVIDSQSRSVWVFVGKDGTFVDVPYFLFGMDPRYH
jgi:hypothetical protein